MATSPACQVQGGSGAARPAGPAAGLMWGPPPQRGTRRDGGGAGPQDTGWSRRSPASLAQAGGQPLQLFRDGGEVRLDLRPPGQLGLLVRVELRGRGDIEMKRSPRLVRFTGGLDPPPVGR